MRLNLSKLFVVILTSALSLPVIAALDIASKTVGTMVVLKECPEYPPKCGLDCQSH